ncbi:MAG: FAD-dependent oxidoreductase [Actinomycetota bacterium]
MPSAPTPPSESSERPTPSEPTRPVASPVSSPTTGRARSVVIIGAGLAGLVAGRELAAAGVDVTLIDKGRSVGGRLATRRIGNARLDHGAQFFTVRTPAFQARVDDWLDRGVVRVWTRGFGDEDGHPRYVGTDGMNSLAKDLASELHVETSTMVFAVRPNEAGAAHRWRVVIDDDTVREADAVVLTAPLPQSFALLIDTVLGERDAHDAPTDGDTDHGVEFPERLFRTEYDRTIGLLCAVDGPTAISSPGGLQDPDDVFSFIGDNAAKGISGAPAVTFHAGPTWSEDRWDDDPDEVLADLIDAATPWLGDASIVESQLKKWRFATPRTVWPDPCWVTADSTIVLAGDAFAGPRVEAAHNSGLAAAHALLG